MLRETYIFWRRITNLVEKEIETWYRTDPDPFDDRHPGRSDPECSLGNVLKVIFKNENLMNKVCFDRNVMVIFNGFFYLCSKLSHIYFHFLYLI